MTIVSHLESAEWLILIAALVAILARRLRLPYAVGLLGAGIAVAFSPWRPEIQVTKGLVFALFLPPLVFEAAFALRWPEVRRDLAPLVAMATVGVLLSTGVVYLGFTRGLGWDWRPALMFSALISATDPVAVIAMLKDAGAKGRFPLLLEAESLFNDGTAAALFVVALAAVGPGSTPGAAAIDVLRIAAGGLACGAVVGVISLFVMGRTDDHLVEITCTVGTAFGAFQLAEHFGFSGVLATVVAGLVLGNTTERWGMTERGRAEAEGFWEFLAFLVNSFVFLLMGARIARGHYGSILGAAGAAIVLVTLGRATAVYGTMAAFARTRWRLDIRSQHLLVWGGMRGALALALALGLPPDLPLRSEVVNVTFAVVAFSTIVQGITMKPALKSLRQEAQD